MRARLGIAVMVLFGAAACGGGGDRTAPPAQTAAAAPSTQASAPPAAAADTVALGTVLDKGAPKPGVPVLVVALPNSATLDKQKVGEDVQTVVVAKGTTDASGHFNLGLDPAKLDPMYVEDDGSVALELVLQDETGPSTEFTAMPADKGWATVDGEKPFEANVEATADGELKVKRLDVTETE
ncbi:hypothetical protein J5X84_43620 [Streptosporangiaceae bacterium NEAU-GS5]|nr:hypothetical protein [Streptosporangiaceae bacterium NEAU-GS5]